MLPTKPNAETTTRRKRGEKEEKEKEKREKKKGVVPFRGPPIGLRRFPDGSYVKNKQLGRRI